VRLAPFAFAEIAPLRRIDPLTKAVLSDPALFSVVVNKSWKGIGSYSTVGLDFTLSILVGLLGGRWLDRKFGTGGWLTIIGLGFGIAAGVRTLMRALKQANREAEEAERKDREERTKFHDKKDD
jgi:ATP synthase protein I